MLNKLANELLLNIIEFLSPPEDFASADNRPHPPLKSLSKCSRRFYGLCFPYLYRTIRLRLRHDTAQQEIQLLRRFLATAQIRTVDAVALDLGHHWNDGRIGLVLKKLLWELHVRSLSLHQARGHESVREKCAKWSYHLEHIERLRIRTVDDDVNLKMLLLRQCPARWVSVDDGDFTFESGRVGPSVELLHDRQHCPALASMKPALFPRLERLAYRACWPSLDRFTIFLLFVTKLPALRHFTVVLMDGEDLEDMKATEIWFRPTENGMRYRQVISAYKKLGLAVDGMETLERLVVGDRRNPFASDTAGPRLFTESSRGEYVRIAGAGE